MSTGTDGFGTDNLPYGAILRPGEPAAHLAVRLGDAAIDLHDLATQGAFDAPGMRELPEVLRAPVLNPLLDLGAASWQAVRQRVRELADDGTPQLVELDDVTTVLPFDVADYVDFYSCEYHALNLSRLFRPDAAQLPAAWKRLPIGYHGRAGTVCASGTPVTRPAGHQQGTDGEVRYGPSAALDIELELGFVTGGPATHPGTVLDLASARQRIFGFVLVNDWSARDLQRFEYVPLGPFLGKSFSTSVGAWITPAQALDAAHLPAPQQEPAPLGPLGPGTDPAAAAQLFGLDIDLTVLLRPAGDSVYHVVSQTNSSNLYWTCTQQLVHAAANGASVRPGDLYASGTISGPEAGSQGSLIELSWNGQHPLQLRDTTRSWLQDGDSVLLRATTSGGIRLADVEGTIMAAPGSAADGSMT